MTKSEIWSPVTAYYDLLAAPGSGLMRANSPWSAGNQEVDVTGWYLSGNPLNRFQFQIPSGYVLPPRGYLLAWADNEPAQNLPFNGDLHVNFDLPGSSVIGLYTPAAEQMDLVDLTSQPPGVSCGSRVDGTGPICTTITPTPRASNRQIKINSIAASAADGVTLAVDGIPETAHRMLSAGNLAATNWTESGTATARADGSFQFTDASAPSATTRYYRVNAP